MKSIRAKKSLGQHFLRSKTALQKIIQAAEISPDDIVLEIGPGKGVLTKKLLQKAKQVIAVEIDKEMIFYLEEKFSEAIKRKKLILIQGDILDPRILNKLPKKFLVVANIPYYITNAIIKTLLESKKNIPRIVLLIQKEVAERIIAKNKKQSLLSLSVMLFGKAKIISKVKREAFSPPPKVDSAILRIDLFSSPIIKEEKERKNFFVFLHFIFSQKRKKLLTLLKQKKNENEIDLLKACKIEQNARAEKLTIQQLLCLFQKIKKRLSADGEG